MNEFDATVVIPAFNASATIAESIASVHLQAVAPRGGVVVVDDGSTDATAEVAAAHGATVIRQSHAGPGAARNRGIAGSTTAWIALLDADDICTPIRFSAQARSVEACDSQVAVIAGGRAAELTAADGTIAPIGFDSLWARNGISTSTVLLRRTAWEAAGGFDESSEVIGVEDYNLWLRLVHAGWTFVVLREALAEYRPTRSSLSRQTRHFAKAELANVRRLATALDLPEAIVAAKTRTLCSEYGIELFHFRDREGARELFRRAAELGPLSWPERLRLWATWLPISPR